MDSPAYSATDTAGGAAPANFTAWIERKWNGRQCLLEERGEYIAAAREWADHPDFAPPRYGYGNPADVAIRQCIEREYRKELCNG